MSERASVFEKPRFGKEDPTTPGVPVTAANVLQSLTVGATPKLPRDPIKAKGRKVPVGQTGQKQWTELSFDGSACYLDAAFGLQSALCAATSVAGSGGGVGTTTLTWEPKADSPDVLQTYTIDLGSEAGSARIPGCFFTDLGFTFSKTESKFSGKGLGRRYDPDVTLATGTDVPIVPVEASTISVFVSDTLAGLTDSGARLKRCTSANWSLTGRQSALMTLDDTEGSFSCSLEKEFDLKAQIVLMQNSQGIAIMNKMRQKKIFFVRITAIGYDIVAGYPYKLTITFPCYATEVQLSDSDDMYAGTYDLQPVIQTDAFGSGHTSYVKVEMVVPTAFVTTLTTAGTTVAGYDKSVVASTTAVPDSNPDAAG